MVVLAAAVVPHPPILVPALAAGAAGELAPLLAACDAAVAGLIATEPRVVVGVGPGERTTRYPDADWGSLAGFGVAVDVPAEHARTPPSLPLSLTLGRWLLARAGWTGPLVLQSVGTATSSADAARLGRQLAAEAGPGAVWLVLGDGSNRRGPSSPGHDDERAPGFDADVARAFADADPAAILALDAGLAAELGAGGRVAWQALAGAALAGTGLEGGEPERTGLDRTGSRKGLRAAGFDAEVRYDQAPFGVEYLVAGWSARR